MVIVVVATPPEEVVALLMWSGIVLLEHDLCALTRPPTRTRSSIAGSSLCSHTDFTGKQGVSAVPFVLPVTLQSCMYGTPTACLIGLPLYEIRPVAGSLLEKRTFLKGILGAQQQCSAIKTLTS